VYPKQDADDVKVTDVVKVTDDPSTLKPQNILNYCRRKGWGLLVATSGDLSMAIDSRCHRDQPALKDVAPAVGGQRLTE
jgi:hypothetical protein